MDSAITPSVSQEPIGKVARGYFWEMCKVIALSCVIVFSIRHFLLQPFYVKGASMVPTFVDKEYLVIDRLSYRFHVPVRGDVVVFRPPGDEHQYYIKRVIGLPGETVSVANGVVSVSNTEHPKGFVLDERIYLSSVATPLERTEILGPHQYFLMGDNRSVSFDSRSFGPVTDDRITGRVWFRAWPVDRAAAFSSPVPYPLVP